MNMVLTCPTVKVENGEGGFMIINESDFDKKEHKKFAEKPEKKEKPAK